MPLCKCPRCAVLFDFHVLDVKTWHAEKWPGYSSSELTPELCPACTKEEYGRQLEAESLRAVRECR